MYKADTNGGQANFWKEAEMIEMIVDATARTGNTTYKGMINELYNGFVSRFGSDWSGNIYNDDIAWMCLAALRGYEINGNTEMKNNAKANFDKMYARAWSSDLGGGLWWTTDNTSKNACINGPAALVAYTIYKDFGDSSYLKKAEDIYAWQRSNLFDTSTGRVNDNISSTGSIDNTAYTYNQGTFIGVASYLYKATQKPSYLNDAQLAADYTKNNMCNSSGLLPDEYGTSDQPGFKGIFARWMSRFIYDCDQSQYTSWMQYNQNQAWSIKNSTNLVWSQWGNSTPNGYLTSWESSSAVVMLFDCP